MRAQIKTMGGLSGHAGQKDLLHWFDAMAPSRPRVILTHGEDKARNALKAIIAERHHLHAELPAFGETIEF